jgi:hypothetical protein
MQVGKKYRRREGITVWTITATTSRGNVIADNEGREVIIRAKFFGLYVEVKEPVVRYFHWFDNNGNVTGWTTTEEETPKPMSPFKHLRTDRIEYCG